MLVSVSACEVIRVYVNHIVPLRDPRLGELERSYIQNRQPVFHGPRAGYRVSECFPGGEGVSISSANVCALSSCGWICFDMSVVSVDLAPPDSDTDTPQPLRRHLSAGT